MDERKELLSAVEVERVIRAGSYMTREALARCVETVQHRTSEDVALSGRIREDHSFDIAAIVELDPPEVVLLKYEGQTAISRRYDREAVVAALGQLDYTYTLAGLTVREYWRGRFPSIVIPSEAADH